MDVCITLIIFINISIVIVCLSIYLGHCYWKRYKNAKYVISGLLVFLTWSIYTAIYPEDSFYEDEFERVSGLKFPKSAEVVIKDASYPDIHGDYSSCFVIKANNNDIQVLGKKAIMLESPQVFSCNKSEIFQVIKIGEVNKNNKLGEYYFWGITESGLIVGNYWSS